MDFSKYKRIVIKIGSSTLTDREGNLQGEWLRTLGQDVRSLVDEDKELVIVTSGGVSLGRNLIGKPNGKLRLEEKQAAFACGQTKLLQGYEECFSPLITAQILLNPRDTEERRNYLNAKNAIETIIAGKIIPVINENDVVAAENLRYGDNDRLSARVAQMLGADLLILLTDVDGLYTETPKPENNAELVEEVTKITDEIIDMAGGTDSASGTGGMHTKIEAAKIATNAGCDCIISTGANANPIRKIQQEDQNYTIFQSKTNPHTARKSWILGSVQSMGEIIVDDGAEKALRKGSSLLPAGANKVIGNFQRGGLVIIAGKNGEIARGLVAYSSDDAKKIIGKQSSEIEEIVGYAGRDELMHRDDMVLTVVKDN